MILASKSPRRKEILEGFGFDIIIESENIEEVSSKEEIEDKIVDIAYKKTVAVAEKHPNAYVTGADTVVILDGEILGKPIDKDDAAAMLRKLSGKDHTVLTAYTFININKKVKILNYDVTKVWFHDLTDDEIKWYINTGEPMDKAGSYGIQGKGAAFVKKIDGDFFNVMGFPLSKFIYELKDNGFEIKEILKI